MKPKKLSPGPWHPISVEPTGERVVVRAGGEIVADTTNALTLREGKYDPVHYIPQADVNRNLIRPSAGSTHCPFKGDASYYALLGPGGEIEDAVWTYEEPYEAVAGIEGHLAFYPQHVEISVGES